MSSSLRPPLSYDEINRRVEERRRQEADTFLADFKAETIAREQARAIHQRVDEQRERDTQLNAAQDEIDRLKARMQALKTPVVAMQPEILSPSAPPLKNKDDPTDNDDEQSQASPFFPRPNHDDTKSTSSPSSSSSELSVFTSKLSWPVTWLLCACLYVGERVFACVRPRLNAPVYHLEFTNAKIRRRIPLWAVAMREFCIVHQEGLMLTVMIFGGLFFVFSVAQLISLFGAPLFDRRDTAAFSAIGRKLTPLTSQAEADRFFQLYVNYDTDIRIIQALPASVSTTTTNALGDGRPLTPDRDMDGNGRDDEIDRLIEHLYAASANWVDMETSSGAPVTQATPVRVILPRVSPVNDALCGSLFPQYDARYDKIMQRRGCWDIYKFNLDSKYNNEAYEYRRVRTQRQYARSMEYRRDAQNDVRNKLATILTVTNLEVGVATPFIYLGYHGLDTELMIHPEMLSLQPGDDEEARLRHYMDTYEGQRSSVYQPGLEQASQYVFKAARTVRETSQPRGVRIRYYTLPSDEQLNAYYTSRFGDTYNVWLEAEKERFTVEQKTAASDHWLVRVLRWVAEKWTSSKRESSFEAIHEHVLDYRTEVFHNRYAQMLAYNEGTAFQVSSKLRALNVTLDEPAYKKRFDRPPTLVKVEKFFPYPHSKYIVEALTQISAWAHRRQDLHDYKTGHRATGMPAEDEPLVLQYFQGQQVNQLTSGSAGQSVI